MAQDRPFFDGFARDLLGFDDSDIDRLLNLCGSRTLATRHSLLATPLLGKWALSWTTIRAMMLKFEGVDRGVFRLLTARRSQIQVTKWFRCRRRGPLRGGGVGARSHVRASRTGKGIKKYMLEEE